MKSPAIIVLTSMSVAMLLLSGCAHVSNTEQGMANTDTSSNSSAANDAVNANTTTSTNPLDGNFTYDDVKSDDFYYEETVAENFVHDEATGLTYANNELLLFVSKEANKEDIEGLVSPQGGSIVGYLSGSSLYQIRFDKTYAYSELKDIANEYEKSSLVSSASLNLRETHSVESIS